MATILGILTLLLFAISGICWIGAAAKKTKFIKETGFKPEVIQEIADIKPLSIEGVRLYEKFLNSQLMNRLALFFAGIICLCCWYVLLLPFGYWRFGIALILIPIIVVYGIQIWRNLGHQKLLDMSGRIRSDDTITPQEEINRD